MSTSNTDFERTSSDQFTSEYYKSAFFHEYFDIVRSVPGAFIAGGFVVHWWNPEKYSTDDIDIFFTNQEAIQKVRSNLLDLGWIKCKKSPYMCENWEHSSSKYKVQLIIGTIYEDAFHIIDGFDLICCMMAYDENILYCHKETKNDLKYNLINVHRIRDVIKVRKRVLKYLNKGMNLTPTAFKSIFQLDETIEKPFEIITNIEKYSLKESCKRIIKWNAQ